MGGVGAWECFVFCYVMLCCAYIHGWTQDGSKMWGGGGTLLLAVCVYMYVGVQTMMVFACGVRHWRLYDRTTRGCKSNFKTGLTRTACLTRYVALTGIPATRLETIVDGAAHKRVRATRASRLTRLLSESDRAPKGGGTTSTPSTSLSVTTKPIRKKKKKACFYVISILLFVYTRQQDVAQARAIVGCVV